MKIAVLGAGAWGTALAIQAAARHDTVLWGRDAAQIDAMRSARVNGRYLPGASLPSSLAVSHDFVAAAAHGAEGLLLVATPMAALEDMLRALPLHADVLWVCKGFQAQTGALGHEIAARVRSHGRSGVLSGPSFAQEVAQGRPTALVAASAHPGLGERVIEAFHGEALRIYTSDDAVGVEVGGAVKNVMAIATGIADGLSLGLNARAALITRGLAEMTRLGVALGAKPETFMGLSGLGDLVLTATGDLSRNRRVGQLLAAGQSLPQVLEHLGHVAEGVYSARTVYQRARALGVDMPITGVVIQVLDGRMSPAEAVQALMRREAKSEA